MAADVRLLPHAAAAEPAADGTKQSMTTREILTMRKLSNFTENVHSRGRPRGGRRHVLRNPDARCRGERTFATPQEAAQALTEAASKTIPKPCPNSLDPAGRAIVVSGDPAKIRPAVRSSRAARMKS